MIETIDKAVLQDYIRQRIESLKMTNLYNMGYYSRDEIASRLTELNWLARQFGIEVGPTHNFNLPDFLK